MWARGPAGGHGGVRFRTIPKRGGYGILLVVLVVVAMATTAAILAWVVSKEETEAESNQVEPVPPPPTTPVVQPPPPTQVPPPQPANAQPPPTPPVVQGPPPTTPGPAPGRNFYTPLEGQPTLPFGCTMEVPVMDKKNEARAFCDRTVGCKGYYHVSESGLDDNSGAYHPSSALPSDCTSLASPTSTPDSSITIFYQKEPLAAPGAAPVAAPGAAPGAAPAPIEARWQRKANLDTQHVGAFGTYQPSATIATPNKNYTSMFRACTKNPSSDAPSCVYFASPYIAPTLCPTSTLTSDQFVPKVAAVGATATPTYGEPIPNVDGTKKPRPPACSYVGLLDETEAQERCSAEEKCVGYYKNNSKTSVEWTGNFVLNAFGVARNNEPIEKKAPPDNKYRLSVAKPGECAVDWRPVENTVPVCEKLLGKRPKGKSWIEYTEAKPATYCLPSPTLGGEGGYYADDNFYAIYDVTAKNGDKCPLGWTRLEAGQCLPPCLANQDRDRGHYGEWCSAEVNTNCPAGYERYRRSKKSVPRWIVDGFEGAGSGYHQLTAWDYCVPSPKEINAVISQNK